MNAKEVVKKLKLFSDKRAKEGMARFGINPDFALGVSVPRIRAMAKEIGTNHKLALDLWRTNVHEARILAPMIDDPKLVTDKQMEEWVKTFNSWDVCDQCCINLFKRVKGIEKKAIDWTKRKEEFVKRTGFAVMAAMCMGKSDKDDKIFEKFFLHIKKEARDERNFVKKAVNWALRQIGKKNLSLNKKAIKVAEEIKKINSKSAQWIANDALRELKSQAVQKRLRKC